MIHNMNLWPNSFQAIKNKTKTIEMRLFDKKRSLIKIGDIIEFSNTENKETLRCQVINIYRYSNFEELYQHHNKISIGYKKDETANPQDMQVYYSKEDIAKYGVMALEIKAI